LPRGGSGGSGTVEVASREPPQSFEIDCGSAYSVKLSVDCCAVSSMPVEGAATGSAAFGASGGTLTPSSN